MKNVLLAAAAALMITAAGDAAVAESNNPAAVETPQPARPVFGGSVAGGGSEAYPAFAAASSVLVTAGVEAVLPANGSEGAVQSAASLPRGFSDGTVAFTEVQSVRRYLAERDARPRLATRIAHGRQPG